MAAVSKRIAIIGAGCSGLAAIKSCIEEGLMPVCFEKESNIGGLWNYRDKSGTGHANIYKTCIMNSSRDMMAYSDFPVPDEFPTFMPHDKVMQYFDLYAEKFDLRKYILFNYSVLKITYAEDYSKTGRWNVTYKKNGSASGSAVTKVFDGVMICCGHHTFPNIPEVDGRNEFKGQILHSMEYKTNADFKDKKVLIVGIGNSAVDIAVDASSTAKQVYLSTRRGAWVIPRKGFLGLPMDAIANSRFLFALPKALLQKSVELVSKFTFDHRKYDLLPLHGALQSHPTISDTLPISVMTGKVKIKPDVHSFTSGSVKFTDDTIEDIDVVVFATGYIYKIPFLDSRVVQMEDNSPILFERMYPPRLPHPTLAVIGLFQVVGAVMPVSEMQTRVFARVMQGHVTLPGSVEMETEIEKRDQEISRLFYHSKRHTIQEFWIQYMDRLASLINCKPRLWQMMFKNPSLALQCMFGPCFPTQYRLEGPGKWGGAEELIRKQFKDFLKMDGLHGVSQENREYQEAAMKMAMMEGNNNPVQYYDVQGLSDQSNFVFLSRMNMMVLKFKSGSKRKSNEDKKCTKDDKA